MNNKGPLKVLSGAKFSRGQLSNKQLRQIKYNPVDIF